MGGLAYKKGGLMSYEFKKLGRIEKIDELPADATVLVETNYQVKRVPSSEISTATIAIGASDIIDTPTAGGAHVAVISDELMDSIKKNMSAVFIKRVDAFSGATGYTAVNKFVVIPNTDDMYIQQSIWVNNVEYTVILAQSSVDVYAAFMESLEDY